MQSPSVFAPSECEPLKENAEHITRYIAACIRRGIVLPNADAWADALQRVADGLAARPKVEDAEVAELATKLRRALGWSKTRDGLCLQAADLLERLASELVTAKGGWEGAMDKWDHALNAGALLKAKLAKREAELARVDGFLILGWTLDDAIAEHPDDGIGEIAEKVKERHAARQQQKA